LQMAAFLRERWGLVAKHATLQHWRVRGAGFLDGQNALRFLRMTLASRARLDIAQSAAPRLAARARVKA